METKEGLELERMKHKVMGEIVHNLSSVTNQKDMEEIREFVEKKTLK